MTLPTTVECDLHLLGRSRQGVFPIPQETSRVPRLSRLMALAIRMEDLIRAGGIADYSALAQLGHVSRARITQIMNLLLLAPDIQEQILFLSFISRRKSGTAGFASGPRCPSATAACLRTAHSVSLRAAVSAGSAAFASGPMAPRASAAF